MNFKAIFRDVFDLVIEFAEVKDTDEYWSMFTKRVNALVLKHNKDELMVELVAAVGRWLDTQNNKKRKMRG